VSLATDTLGMSHGAGQWCCCVQIRVGQDGSGEDGAETSASMREDHVGSGLPALVLGLRSGVQEMEAPTAIRKDAAGWP